MSLFPAYKDAKLNVAEGESHKKASKDSSKVWLQNISFSDEYICLKNNDNDAIAAQNLKNPEYTDSSESSENDIEKELPTVSVTKSAKYNENYKSSTSVGISNAVQREHLHKVDEENFYTDRYSGMSYKNVRTPCGPASLKYHKKSYHKLQSNELINHEERRNKRWTRYYLSKQLIQEKTVVHVKKPMQDNIFLKQVANLNVQTIKSPKILQNWIDLIELQDYNPFEWSRSYIANKKIDNLQKALCQIPSNPQLYKIYIQVLTSNYSISDINKMMESLIKKDAYCYQLWNAYIMMTQGVMSKCNVPDVLALYKRSMRIMLNANTKKNLKIDKATLDDTALRLFHNCALFLRQTGLFEQFITLIKFMIESNINNSTEVCNGLTLRSDDDAILINYEELIFKSNLNSTEMWLGIEKLRQGFYFLPFIGLKEQCTDWQRIVSKDDVFHCIYPLTNSDNTFKLLLIILKLLKFSFIRTDCLAKCIELDSNSDAIEDLLTVFLQPIHILSSFQRKPFYQFERSVYELVKELVIPPTYFNNVLMHDKYEHYIRDYILNCSKIYPDNDKRRLVFLILWCRFERLLLTLNHCGKKLTPEMIKKSRLNIRSLLKEPNNRNKVLLYVEYALFEYEAGSNQDTIKNILKNIIINSEDEIESNLSYVYVTYAELLFGWNTFEEACQVLCYYALNVKMPFQLKLNKTRQLAALKILHNQLESIINIEKHVNIMNLEQYILPDGFISTLKAYVMLLCILQEKKDALNYLDNLLTIFKKGEDNNRHNYIREMIHEVYFLIMQIQCDRCVLSKKFMAERIYNALQEYPRNVLILELWGSVSWMLWYKIRRGFLQLPSSLMSVMMLIVAARYRYLKDFNEEDDVSIKNSSCLTIMTYDYAYHEKILHQRIANMLKALLSHDPLNNKQTDDDIEFGSEIYRNALLWRCFFRTLNNENIDNHVKKKWLFSALDACPWNKSLYLEGAVLMPEMTAYLQNFIIEKQLRLHAVAEEMLILKKRNN